MNLLLLATLLAPARAAPCVVDVAPSRCATTAVFAAWSRGEAAACPTGWRDLGLGVRDPALLRRGNARAGEKLVRDAIGTFNVVETDNFAVKWGNTTSFSQADVEALASALETSWQTEIDGLGYPEPPTTENYKLNVYVGDTGLGAPSSLGNAGYYWFDDEGYPMLVIGAATVGDRSAAALTAAHEFFHAVQDATGYFEWGGRNSDWYGEATAVWMENEVWPDNPDYAAFIYWFAIRPELQLTFYDYPDEGTPEEFHQYGAFVFIEHLAENVGDSDLIRRSFLAGFPGAEPLGLLAELVADEGGDLEDAFADFVGRNATWDYEHGDWYDYWISAYGGFTGDSHRPTGTLSEASDWIAPTADLPRGWGANYWRLRGFADDAVVFFDGTIDPERLPDRWTATVAVRAGATHRRHDLEIVDGIGSLAASDVGPYDEAWLVVAPLAQPGFREYPYAVRLDAVDPETPAPPRACGCATGSTGGGGPLWVVLLWAFHRRARLAGSPRRGVGAR